MNSGGVEPELLVGRALDAAVAEKVMGWPNVPIGGVFSASKGGGITHEESAHRGHPVKFAGFGAPTLWSPSTDLNACFEAQAKCIEMVGEWNYSWALKTECKSREFYYAALVATAEQRCRAMLAVLLGKGGHHSPSMPEGNADSASPVSAGDVRDSEASAMSGVSAYRKKPVVIEAVQWLATKVSWGAILVMGCPWEPGEMGSESFYIPTLEGKHKATKGDWIIKGIKGEFYPCKPDIFALTYELVDTSQQGTTQQGPVTSQPVTSLEEPSLQAQNKQLREALETALSGLLSLYYRSRYL